VEEQYAGPSVLRSVRKATALATQPGPSVGVSGWPGQAVWSSSLPWGCPCHLPGRICTRNCR
jgi:hypothetical protein